MEEVMDWSEMTPVEEGEVNSSPTATPEEEVMDWSEMTPIYDNNTERIEGYLKSGPDYLKEVIARKREQGASDDAISEAIDIWSELQAKGESADKELLKRGIDLNKPTEKEIKKGAVWKPRKS